MRALLGALALLALAQPATAHTRSQSQSSWTIEGDVVTARVEAAALDVTRLYALGGEGDLAATFATEVDGGFSVSAAGKACAEQGDARALPAPAGRIAAIVQFACPEGALVRGPVEIGSALFLDVAPSHLHFAVLRDADGASAEAVLTESRPRAELNPRAAAQAESFWGAFARFVPIGAEHVWGGLDHVAFMLALVVLTAGSWRAVVLAATGFTLGHTATLGLAALGVLRPDSGAVEALIGFTIAFVALEAGAGGEQRMHTWSAPAAVLLALGGVAAMFALVGMSPLVWLGLAAFVFAYPRGFPRGAQAAIWLAVIFGLIHGCGFAGALGELDLPRPRLVASLLGFNVGVELGQLTVIGGALAVGALVRRAPDALRAQSVSLAGAALFAVGLYWFASRVL